MHTFNPFREAEYEPDEIFTTNERARAAKAKGKDVINCSVGEPKGEDGELVQFSSVDEAQRKVRENFFNYEYGYGLPGGLTNFRSAIRSLLFLPHDIPVAMHSTGTGSASLALNLRTLRRGTTIITPVPGWINNEPMIKEAGLNVITVPYLDASGKPAMDPIIEKLRKTKGDVAVLDQAAGGQNPTGKDRPTEQWEELANFGKYHPFMMQFDVSYAGFAKGPEEDAVALNIFARAGLPFSVSYCAGKNHAVPGFGGAMACTVVRDEKERKTIEALYPSIARCIPASSIAMTQSMIAYVQLHEQQTWRKDVSDFRETVDEKRADLKKWLPDFENALSGNGMFAEFLQLHSEDFPRLENEHDTFIPSVLKRVNLSAIPYGKLERFADSIKAVMKRQ